MFTRMGKNTITTTTAALDCQSKPNHMTRIGAMPTIGRAATKFPIGSRPRCRNGLRSMAMAVRTASAAPRSHPVSAPLTSVCHRSDRIIGRSAAKRAPMAEGAGRITDGTA